MKPIWSDIHPEHLLIDHRDSIAAWGNKYLMRNFINLIENSLLSRPDREEVDWWIARHISGSLTDPDWDFGEPLTHDANSAMRAAKEIYGNRKSINRTLRRYIEVSRDNADKMMKEQMIHPWGYDFQSFTTASRKTAIEIGEELSRGGEIGILITLKPSPDLVLFGMDDLKGQYPDYNTLEDWHHQNEVLVLVTSPIAAKIEIIQ